MLKKYLLIGVLSTLSSASVFAELENVAIFQDTQVSEQVISISPMDVNKLEVADIRVVATKGDSVSLAKFSCESFCVSKQAEYIDNTATYIVGTGSSISSAYNSMAEKCTLIPFTKESFGHNLKFGKVEKAYPEKACRRVPHEEMKKVSCKSYCVPKNAVFIDSSSRLVIGKGVGKNEAFEKMAMQCTSGSLYSERSFGERLSFGKSAKATLDNVCSFF